MPRKTKETAVQKQTNLNEKIDALIKNVLEVDDKKTTKKTKSDSATTTKSKMPKTTKSAIENNKEKTKVEKKLTKIKAEKAAPKKTTAKAKVAKSSTKKESTKKTTKIVKNTKKVAPKSIKNDTVKKTSKVSTKVVTPSVVEYYDLPYKYNQTVVKALYQNPTTLFVYWEISDTDIERYKNMYGENFFETTRPVLVVHNSTMNYSFEIDINDFANSWYFNINDSKCDYRVELIRRPVFYNEKIKTDYIHITSSNKIETPNDKILFSTNEPYTVYFKNTKNNVQRKVNLPKLLEKLNLNNKDFGFPIVRNVYDLYKNIYNIEDVGEFSISLTNPSSGNPSSHSLSSKFI